MTEIRELRIFEMGNETVMANILDRTSDESDFTAKVFLGLVIGNNVRLENISTFYSCTTFFFLYTFRLATMA